MPLTESPKLNNLKNSKINWLTWPIELFPTKITGIMGITPNKIINKWENSPENIDYFCELQRSWKINKHTYDIVLSLININKWSDNIDLFIDDLKYLFNSCDTEKIWKIFDECNVNNLSNLIWNTTDIRKLVNCINKITNIDQFISLINNCNNTNNIVIMIETLSPDIFIQFIEHIPISVLTYILNNDYCSKSENTLALCNLINTKWEIIINKLAKKGIKNKKIEKVIWAKKWIFSF